MGSEEQYLTGQGNADTLRTPRKGHLVIGTVVVASFTWVWGAGAASGQGASLLEHDWIDYSVEPPANVTIITGDRLRQTGARFLTDAFRMLTGVEVLRTNSTESNVSIRGYSDTASATQGMMGLIDGRRTYNPFFGNVLWDIAPVSLDDIDFIEVIRGPSSPSYGSDAMHGLINIVTKSPLDYEGDYLSTTMAVGSYRSVVGSLILVRKHEDTNTALKVRLGWDDIQNYSDISENAKGQAHLDLRLAQEREWGRLEVSGGVSDQRLTALFPTLFGLIRADLRSEAEESYLKANYKHGGVRAQLTWSAFDANAVPDKFYTPFRVDLDVIDFDVQYSTPAVEDHFLSFGVGYRVSTFDTKHSDVTAGRHQTDLAWVFFQDDWRIDKVLFTYGARYDEHSVTGGELSPRIAAVWQMSDDHFLRGSIAFGHRDPSLREIWFDMPVNDLGFPASVLGNENLDPERMRSFEIGYYGYPVDVLTKDTSPSRTPKVGVSLYYNMIDDLISFVQQGTVITPQNKFDEESYGFELEGEWSREWSPQSSLTLFGNYSRNYRRDRNPAPNTDKEVGKAPRSMANVGTRIREGKFRGMLWLNFFGETEFLEPKVKVDEYYLLNGQISYKWTENIDVFIQGMNILDNDHREHPEADDYGATLMVGFQFRW